MALQPTPAPTSTAPVLPTRAPSPRPTLSAPTRLPATDLPTCAPTSKKKHSSGSGKRQRRRLRGDAGRAAGVRGQRSPYGHSGAGNRDNHGSPRSDSNTYYGTSISEVSGEDRLLKVGPRPAPTPAPTGCEELPLYETVQIVKQRGKPRLFGNP